MKFKSLYVLALMSAPAAAWAQMSPNMQMSTPMKASAPMAQASSVMTNGTVQKVDSKDGVITLKHGEIANLAMPAMTMGFQVADKKMLNRVKPGEKVRFHVEMLNGVATITQIEAAH